MALSSNPDDGTGAKGIKIILMLEITVRRTWIIIQRFREFSAKVVKV